MTALFGTKYFGFIASAYGITGAVLLGLIIWVFVTQHRRRVALAALERDGLRRADNDG